MDQKQFQIRKDRSTDPSAPDRRYVVDYVKSGRDYQKDHLGVVREKPYLPALVMDGVDNEDGTGTLTLQVTDWQGNNVADPYLLDVRLAATSLGAPADLGDVSADTGRILVEDVADALIRVETNAAGLAVLTLTRSVDGTTYVHVSIVGRVTVGGLAITGNS